MLLSPVRTTGVTVTSQNPAQPIAVTVRESAGQTYIFAVAMRTSTSQVNFKLSREFRRTPRLKCSAKTDTASEYQRLDRSVQCPDVHLSGDRKPALRFYPAYATQPFWSVVPRIHTQIREEFDFCRAEAVPFPKARRPPHAD